jgi:hypothetical protein
MIIFALRGVIYIAYFAFVYNWKLLEFAKENIPATRTKQPTSEH